MLVDITGSEPIDQAYLKGLKNYPGENTFSKVIIIPQLVS